MPTEGGYQEALTFAAIAAIGLDGLGGF
jgi:hypothetical protein